VIGKVCRRFLPHSRGDQQQQHHQQQQEQQQQQPLDGSSSKNVLNFDFCVFFEHHLKNVWVLYFLLRSGIFSILFT